MINKIDRPNARPNEVLDEVLDLFIELNADEAQLEFPVVYANALLGVAKHNLEEDSSSLKPLFDTILKEVPPPQVDPKGPFQMLVSNIDYDNYLGKYAVGKIIRGQVLKHQRIIVMGANNTILKRM